MNLITVIAIVIINAVITSIILFVGYKMSKKKKTIVQQIDKTNEAMDLLSERELEFLEGLHDMMGYDGKVKKEQVNGN